MGTSSTDILFTTLITTINDEKSDLKTRRLKAAEEFLDLIERGKKPCEIVIQTFISTAWRILKSLGVDFSSRTPSNKFRMKLIEILRYIPMSELPKARNYLAMFTLLESENDRNALEFLKFLSNFTRAFLHPTTLESYRTEVENLLNFFVNILKNIANNKEKIFFHPKKFYINAEGSNFTNIDELFLTTQLIRINSSGEESIECDLFPKASNSIQFASEYVVYISLVFGIYSINLAQWIPPLLTQIITLLRIFPGDEMNRDDFNVDCFVEFISLQVRCLNILTTLTKNNSEFIVTNCEVIMNSFVNILTYLPPPVSLVKREAISSIRSFIGTDLKRVFVNMLDKIFDDNIFSNGYTCIKSLRPLACSLYCEILMTNDIFISPIQTGRFITFCGKCILEETQTNAQKYRLKALASICTRIDPLKLSETKRTAYDKILRIFLLKLMIIRRKDFSQITDFARDKRRSADVREDLSTTIDSVDNNDKMKNNSKQKLFMQLNDAKALVKMICYCVFNIITKSYNELNLKECELCDGNTVMTCNMIHLFPGECKTFAQIILHLVQCLYMFSWNVDGSIMDVSKRKCNANFRDEMELIDSMGTMLSSLHPFCLKEIVHQISDKLMDLMLNHPSVVFFYRCLHIYPPLCFEFSTAMFEHITHKLDSTSDPQFFNLYVKCFSNSTLGILLSQNMAEFPHTTPDKFSICVQTVRSVLVKYFPQLTIKCINLIPHTRSIPPVLSLLKTLFKSVINLNNDDQINIVASHQFEIINDLFAIYSANHVTHIKESVIELFYLYPVKYSDFVLYLNILRTPIIDGLRTKNIYLQNLCLRFIESILEFCNLESIKFVNLFSGEVIHHLISAARCTSISIAVAASRIIGKIGGDARKNLLSKSHISTFVEERIRESPTIYINWNNHQICTQLPILEILEFAFKKIFYEDQPDQVASAFAIASNYLLSCVDVSGSHDFTLKLLDAEWLKQSPKVDKYRELHPMADECYRDAFRFAFLSVLVNYNRDDYRNKVQCIIRVVVRHISIVAVTRELGMTEVASKPDENERPSIDILVLMETFLEALSLDHSLYASVNSCLTLIVETVSCVCRSNERALELSFFAYFFEKSYNMCFGDGLTSKFAGCRGIRLIINLVPNFSVRYSLESVRALLHVLGNLSEVASVTDIFGQKIIQSVIQSSLSAAVADDKHTASFIKVLKTLIVESFSIYPSSRRLCQSILLEIYQKRPNLFVEAVEESQDLIRNYVDSFRVWMEEEPFYSRVGIIEGMIFFMSRIGNICCFDFTQEYNRQTIELVIEILENPMELLAIEYSFREMNEYIECVRSLMRFLAALRSAEFCKDKIFCLLCKHLVSREVPIRECAFNCMTKFLENYKPEDELVVTLVNEQFLRVQSFLVMDICNFDIFTNVMSLFPSFITEAMFKQFLMSFENALEFIASQRSTTFHPLSTDNFHRCVEQLKMISKVPTLKFYTTELFIKAVLKLEYLFYIEVCDPLRAPLRHILCRFPGETICYILSDPSNRPQQYLNYFLKTLKHRECEVIIVTLFQYGEKINEIITSQFGLIAKYLSENNQQSEDRSWLCIHFILKLIRIILERNKSWINQNPFLLNTLTQLLSLPQFLNRCRNFGSIMSLYWKDMYLLIRILLTCYQQRQYDFKLLFDMLICFDSNFLRIFDFLKNFLNTTVANTYSIEWKKQAFDAFLELMENPQIDDNYRGRVLKYVVFYSYRTELEKGNVFELFGAPCHDPQYSNTPLDRFLKIAFSEECQNWFSTFLQISLGRMLKLLIQHAHHYFHTYQEHVEPTEGITISEEGVINQNSVILDFRLKNLIAYCCDFFGYSGNNIDLMCKYYRYLLFAYCVNKFCLAKPIIKSIYLVLIKAHHQCCQNVVREALDVLIPLMANDKNNYEYLFHWIEQLVIEEVNGGQMFHILQLIIRHQRTFYPVIAKLLPTLLNVVSYLGISKNALMEHRQLSFDVLEMMIRWVVDNHSQIAPNSAVRFVSKQHYAEIIRCMIKIAHPSDGNDTLASRCFDLLKVFIERKIYTTISDINVPWFEDVINESEKTNYSQTNYTYVIGILSLVFVQLDKTQFGQIMTFLQPSLLHAFKVCSTHFALKAIHALIRRLMLHFPDVFCNSKVVLLRNDCEELSSFNNALNKFLNETLAIPELLTGSCSNVIYNAFSILKIGYECYPSYCDGVINQAFRCTRRMVSNYTENNRYQMENNNFIIGTDLICLGIGVVKNRFGMLTAECQKQFIVLLQDLVSSVSDSKINSAILGCIETWIFNRFKQSANMYPSIIDCCDLIERLVTSFEERFCENISIYNRLMTIILHIYSDNSFDHLEYQKYLDPCFLCGLKFHEPDLRSKFFAVFDDNIAKDVYTRMVCFTHSVDWEPVGNYYWIPLALQLLLRCCVDEPISLATKKAVFPSILFMIQKSKTHHKDQVLKAAYKVTETELPFHEFENPQIFFNDSTDKDPMTGLEDLLTQHFAYVRVVKNFKLSTCAFLDAVGRFCFYIPELAHRLWLDLTANVFLKFTDAEKKQLVDVSQAFLNSGYHYLQKGMFPNSIHTLFQMYARFDHQFDYEPATFMYLGLTYQLHYDSLLILESMLDTAKSNPQLALKLFDSTVSRKDAPIITVEEALLHLYKMMREDDFYYSYWLHNSTFSQSKNAVLEKMLGNIEMAQDKFYAALQDVRPHLQSRTVKGKRQRELMMLEEEWVNCARELNQWKHLLPQGENERYFGLDCLEACWHTRSFDAFAELLPDVEERYHEVNPWRVNILKCYHKLSTVENAISTNKSVIEEMENLSRSALTCILEGFRSSSRIVSMEHFKFISGLQILMEITEGITFVSNLFSSGEWGPLLLKGLTILEKAWKTRSFSCIDSFADWALIDSFRKMITRIATSLLSTSSDYGRTEMNINTISDDTIFLVAKLCRKRFLLSNSLEFIEQIKSGTEQQMTLQKAIETVRCHLKIYKYCQKTEEQTTKFRTLLSDISGMLDSEREPYYIEYRRVLGRGYAHLGDEATAIRCLEGCINCLVSDPKAWSTLADIYSEQTVSQRNVENLKQLAICYLQCGRLDSFYKSRIYLAKCFNLLYYDDEDGSIAHYLQDNLCGIPACNWLIWAYHIVDLHCSVKHDGLIGFIEIMVQKLAEPVIAHVAYLIDCYRDDHPIGQRARELLKFLRARNCVIICPSYRLFADFDKLAENIMEKLYRLLNECLNAALAYAFAVRDVVHSECDSNVLEHVRKILDLFENEEFVPNKLDQMIFFKERKNHFALTSQTEYTFIRDELFHSFCNLENLSLQFIIQKCRDWIADLEMRFKNSQQSLCVENACPYLAAFSTTLCDICLPDRFSWFRNFVEPKYILTVSSHIQLVLFRGQVAKRVTITADDGKKYYYYILGGHTLESTRQKRSLKILFNFINAMCKISNTTAMRNIRAPTLPTLCYSSKTYIQQVKENLLSLDGIYRECCASHGLNHFTPIARYYEYVMKGIQRQTDDSLMDWFTDLSQTYKSTFLRAFFIKLYDQPSEFWYFRKRFMTHLSIIYFVSLVFSMEPMFLDRIFMDPEFGSLYMLDWNFKTYQKNETVSPFRVTPNIRTFLGERIVSGPLFVSIMSVIRAFVPESDRMEGVIKLCVQIRVRDEFKTDYHTLADILTKLYIGIVQRANGLQDAKDPSTAKINVLLRTASSIPHLTRMDPSFFPHF